MDMMMNIISALLVLGILGLVFGLVLAVASKVFEVKTDPRFPEIMDCLPGANCGGCGYAGCSAAANAIIEGKASVSCCPVGGAEAAADHYRHGRRRPLQLWAAGGIRRGPGGCGGGHLAGGSGVHRTAAEPGSGEPGGDRTAAQGGKTG